MASEPPPIEQIFNGIDFNPAFFEGTISSSSSGGFTQAQADALYLHYPVAQGIETLISPTVDGKITQTGNSLTNIAIGDVDTFSTNTTGNHNIAIGNGALKVSNTFGNTAIGHDALNSLNAGSGSNVAIGKYAGIYNTTASNCTFIGLYSGGIQSTTAYSNSTALGAYALCDGDHQIVLGSVNDTVKCPNNLNVAGTITAGTFSPANLATAGNLTLSATTSKAIFKADPSTAATSYGASIQHGGSGTSSFDIKMQGLGGIKFYTNERTVPTEKMSIDGSGLVTIPNNLTVNGTFAAATFSPANLATAGNLTLSATTSKLIFKADPTAITTYGASMQHSGIATSSLDIASEGSGGIKFYTSTAAVPTLALTIDQYNNATFAGAVDVPGTLTCNNFITNGNITNGGNIYISAGFKLFFVRNPITTALAYGGAITHGGIAASSLDIYAQGSGGIKFYTNDATAPTEKMSINGAGLVTIPNNLTVNGTLTTTTFAPTNLSVSNNLTLSSGNGKVVYNVDPNTGAGWYGAAIQSYGGSTSTLELRAQGGGGIKFYTNDSTIPSLKMTITGSGNVGLSSNATVSYRLQLDTDSAAKPTTSTWTISSDRRIKEDIIEADINRCYEISKNLKLKYFKWNPKYCKNYTDSHSIGFIAQEVKEYFPNAVGIKSTEFVVGKDDEGNDIKETIEDLHDLNVDQLGKLQWGTISKLINMVEELQNKVALLEAKLN